MARKKTRNLPPPQPGWAMYLRTSSDENQKPELSRARQRMMINEQVLKRSDMTLIGEYIDVLTGTTPERDDYQRMLEDARAGKFSHVIVERPDRFGRNDTEALRAIDELAEFGVAVRFADQPELDPIDPDDRIIVSLQFTLARRESILMGARIQGGQHAKMRDGGCSTLAPDGYKNMEERTERDVRLDYGKYRHWVEPDPEQFKVWRLAWDLLLEDRLTLAEICHELHHRGHRFRSGRPFVALKDGVRRTAASGISKKFHNWFYAGWVVSEAAGIPPKTVRGEWTPLVTTEEFERGLEILAKRVDQRSPRRRHEYLLSQLVFLQTSPKSDLIRLTCSTSNPERSGGGTSYYRVTNTEYSFLCDDVDEQVSAWMTAIQIDPEQLPAIRAAYTKDVAEQLGHLRPSERTRLENELKSIDAEEERTLRLYASGKISERSWDNLWAEWQDKRRTLRACLEGLAHKIDTHIAHLDQALTLIAELGVLFKNMALKEQKALLKEIVDRVVVDPNGTVIRIDLQPPFSYLRELTKGLSPRGGGSGAEKTKTSKRSAAGSCSIDVSSGGPEGRSAEN